MRKGKPLINTVDYIGYKRQIVYFFSSTATKLLLQSHYKYRNKLVPSKPPVGPLKEITSVITNLPSWATMYLSAVRTHQSLLTFMLVVTALCALYLHQYVSCGATQRRPITLNLIHRDFSPQSPYYGHSATPTQKHRKTILRSATRVKHLFGLKNNVNQISQPVFDMPLYISTYILNMSIGTPAVPFIADVDMVSGLTWTQYETCKYCYYQPDPIFDPSKSSTYEAIGCNATTECNIPIHHKCNQDGLCEYAAGYPLSESFM